MEKISNDDGDQLATAMAKPRAPKRNRTRHVRDNELNFSLFLNLVGGGVTKNSTQENSPAFEI